LRISSVEEAIKFSGKMEATTIVRHLRELEKEREIKILLAVESGSRAWGCASPDSDYDVRIIYVRRPDWYLSINEGKDNIDYFEGELLDVSGWDIRKALRLLAGSNATPFEWAQSPVVYFEVPGFREQLLGFARQYFRPGNTLNHYRGIAHNSLVVKDGEEMKLKKMFYVIRPVLAARWIAQRRTVPPMHLEGLLEIVEEAKIKTMIKELIVRKATVNEDYRYVPDPSLVAFLEEALETVKETVLPKPPTVDKEPLNVFFREVLTKSWK
jgi:predicted nucleotidyltransferase